jgi:hypothetical protein
VLPRPSYDDLFAGLSNNTTEDDDLFAGLSNNTTEDDAPVLGLDPCAGRAPWPTAVDAAAAEAMTVEFLKIQVEWFDLDLDEMLRRKDYAGAGRALGERVHG